MRIPDPKANTTTEAYLAYKAGYLEESELKPVLYEPYLHFDGWLAYWDGLTSDYPSNVSKINKLDLKPYSAGGVSVEVVADGMVKVSGTTQNAYANFMTYQTPIDLKAGYYTFSRVGDKTYTASLTVYNEDKTQYMSINIAAGNSSSTANITFDVKYIAGAFTGLTVGSNLDFTTGLQLEAGSEASEFEPYAIPEMLCDEEALVAYLSGVTDTYPEEIKDPYDPRIVGYLRHITSIRFDAPDYPVNNEEFYLSTMEPNHTSNSEPSADIELDTAEGKIISVEAYGDTYQQTYSGKNLISNAFAGSYVSYGDNGFILTKPANRTIQLTFPSLLPAGTYTLSFDVVAKEAPSNIVGSFYAEDITNLGSFSIASTGNFTKTVTTSVAIHHIYMFISGRDPDGSTITIDKMQLETGSTATSFEPYVGVVPAPNPDYPQAVQTVTGEQTVEVTGKNKFNTQNLTTNWRTTIVSSDNNNLVLKPNVNGSGYLTYVIDAKPSTTYTISLDRSVTGSSDGFVGNIAIYRFNGTNQNAVGNVPASTNTFTFTTASDTIELRFLFYSLQTTDGTWSDVVASYTNIQVEESDEKTAYQPYQSQSYTIDLGSIELCKIGDYRDQIFNNDPNEDWYDPDLEDNAWYVHKEVIKISPNGTEEWKTTSTPPPTGQFYVYTSGFDSIVKTKWYSGLVSDNFTMWAGTPGWLTPTTIVNGAVFSNSDSSGAAALRIMFPSSIVSSVETAKTWFALNLPVFYYPIATPTDTKITDATLVGQLEALAGADTYDEKTFIKVTANDPNLPALLKVEAYKY